jgi:phytoene dehydrogenase-like protein
MSASLARELTWDEGYGEVGSDAGRHRLSASPRTFARFVGRPGGYVGGAPRTRGLANFAGMFPPSVRRGLWMVGDSVFPGQSTLATALGGAKVAGLVAKGSPDSKLRRL